MSIKIAVSTQCILREAKFKNFPGIFGNFNHIFVPALLWKLVASLYLTLICSDSRSDIVFKTPTSESRLGMFVLFKYIYIKKLDSEAWHYRWTFTSTLQHKIRRLIVHGFLWRDLFFLWSRFWVGSFVHMIYIKRCAC